MATPEAPFHRLHPVSPLLRSGLFVVAWVGWVINDARNQGLSVGRLALSGVVVLLAGLVYGLASWWFTRYRIDAEEIRIDTGVLVRRSRRIRIERLQAVEVQQPWLARAVGLAELTFEMAGGDTEAKLAFLRMDEATELRRLLLERSGQSVRSESAPPEPVLYRVDAGRLLGSLVLRTGFVAAAVSGAFGILLGGLGGSAIGATVVFGWALGLGTYLLRQFLTWYGFTLRESTQGLRIRSGLLSVRLQTVPAGRVQGVVFVEPMLWRLLGWVRVDVTVAGVARSDENGQQIVSALLPVASRPEAMHLVRHLLAADPVAVWLRPAPAQASRLDPVGRPYLGAGLDDTLVVTRRGVFTTRTDVVPRAKIQSVRVSQGPLQSSLGLASVYVHSPSGPVAATAEHRLEGEAWALALELTRRPTATASPPA